MFYQYTQNNSGGSFVRDEKAGIDFFVIVEADNYNDANSKAEEIGLYFGGEGDCPCCGDRWYPVDRADAEPSPMLYGTSIENGISDAWKAWDAVCYVHYKDGRIVKYT